MVKLVFFSTIKATVFSIIITLIAYNIYSPLKKNPTYKLKLSVEPNNRIIVINSDNPTNLKAIHSDQNSEIVINQIEKIVFGLHEHGNVGECNIKKTKGRIPYKLTTNNDLYELINFELKSDTRASLVNCETEIKKRLDEFFEITRDEILSEYNEIQKYSMQYRSDTHTLKILTELPFFFNNIIIDTNKKDNINLNVKELFDKINENFIKYQLALDEKAKERINEYAFIKSMRSKVIKVAAETTKFSPFLILLNIFLIFVFLIVDLFFFKKLKIKKLLKVLFN